MISCTDGSDGQIESNLLLDDVSTYDLLEIARRFHSERQFVQNSNTDFALGNNLAICAVAGGSMWIALFNLVAFSKLYWLEQ
jgi:hypothetical protein